MHQREPIVLNNVKIKSLLLTIGLNQHLTQPISSDVERMYLFFMDSHVTWLGSNGLKGHWEEEESELIKFIIQTF